MTLAELLAEPFVVNVHESAAQVNTVVACGNLKAAAEMGEARAAADAVGGTGAATYDADAVPAAGVGSAFAVESANATMLVVPGGLAVFLAGMGLTARRPRLGGLSVAWYRLKVRVPFLLRTA